MGRKRQTSDEEVEENDPPSIVGARNHFVAGETKGSLVSEDAHVLQFLVVSFGESRSLPSGDLRLRRRSSAGGGAAHLLRPRHRGSGGAVRNWIEYG